MDIHLLDMRWTLCSLQQVTTQYTPWAQGHYGACIHCCCAISNRCNVRSSTIRWIDPMGIYSRWMMSTNHPEWIALCYSQSDGIRVCTLHRPYTCRAQALYAVYTHAMHAAPAVSSVVCLCVVRSSPWDGSTWMVHTCHDILRLVVHHHHGDGWYRYMDTG